MTRPCFLVIDREYAGNISTRKLVLETAKFNVVTAYSSQEAIETLQRFPNFDGAIVDASLEDMHCNDLVVALKNIQPHLRVVAVSAPHRDNCPEADYHLATFDPARLLVLVKELEPGFCDWQEKHLEELAAKS